MKLYSFWRSSASWRVRIVLALKKVEYEYVGVRLDGEQRGDAYREKNPMAQVPTLEWTENGQTRRLSQSVAIAEYLDVTVPTPALIPRDPVLAAMVRERVEIINAGIQPFQNTSVRTRLLEIDSRISVEDWNQHWIGQGLSALDRRAADSAGRFLVGDEVTLADAFLVPQLYGARRNGLDVSAYPTLARVEKACEALAAFAQADAHRQPDTPADQRKP